MEIASSSAPSQLLLDDSFSYGWLLNVKSSAAAALGDSHRSLDTGSFIEIDPNLVLSLRWTTADPHRLSDDSEELPRRRTLADHLLPFQEAAAAAAAAAAASDSALLRKSQSVNSNRYQGGASTAASSPFFHSAKSSPGSPRPAPRWMTGERSKLDSRSVMRSCAKSPKKIICKYLCFLMPLYRIVKDLRLLSSSASSRSTASCGGISARSSPRPSDALSSVDWCCRKDNADISISDAILHCKMSIVSSKQLL